MLDMCLNNRWQLLMRRFSVIITTLVLVGMGCAKHDPVPSIVDQPEAWSDPVDGLRVGIKEAGMNPNQDGSPQFEVMFENMGSKDFIINLGIALGNGKRHYPTQIVLHLTDSTGNGRELRLKGPVGVAGRVDDYIVPLAVGAAHRLNLGLDQFWCPDTSEHQIQLTSGEYTVAASFRGEKARFINTDMEFLKWLIFWEGRIETKPLSFLVP